MQDAGPDDIVAGGGWVERKRTVRHAPAADKARILFVAALLALSVGGGWLLFAAVPLYWGGIYTAGGLLLLLFLGRRMSTLAEETIEEEVTELVPRDRTELDPRNLY